VEAQLSALRGEAPSVEDQLADLRAEALRRGHSDRGLLDVEEESEDEAPTEDQPEQTRTSQTLASVHQRLKIVPPWKASEPFNSKCPAPPNTLQCTRIGWLSGCLVFMLWSARWLPPKPLTPNPNPDL